MVPRCAAQRASFMSANSALPNSRIAAVARCRSGIVGVAELTGLHSHRKHWWHASGAVASPGLASVEYWGFGRYKRRHWAGASQETARMAHAKSNTKRPPLANAARRSKRPRPGTRAADRLGYTAADSSAFDLAAPRAGPQPVAPARTSAALPQTGHERRGHDRRPVGRSGRCHHVLLRARVQAEFPGPADHEGHPRWPTATGADSEQAVTSRRSRCSMAGSASATRHPKITFVRSRDVLKSVQAARLRPTARGR